DLMRRRRAIEPGTMDFLFVALFLWAARRGYASFNMGLSPLYRVGVDPGSSLLERFIHILYEDSSFYDFKGLNGFKSKFRPEWTPQYLVFPSYTGFLVVGLALARLNAGPGESLLGYFRPPARITGD
ncbi:MAG: phosphatidylglycerol lysyltransferase domain-containing protein, partial [Chloroflexota bacterium]